MIYLSVDLDYWCRHQSPDHCDKFFDKVFGLGLPILVCVSHHHMMLDIETSGCDELWNIDWHSDLPDETSVVMDELNEGTWGAFISWRHTGTFVWRFPSDACLTNAGWGGYCHADDCNPFTDKMQTKWSKAILRRGTAAIPWHRVKRIGVVMSPYWVGKLSVIDYPLRQLRVRTTMHRFVSATTCPSGQHDIRCYTPKIVKV